MRNAAQRLARLAEVLNFSSAGDCICAARPSMAVTMCDPDGHDLPSDSVELSKLAFTCPVHGTVGPQTHIRVTRFSTAEAGSP